MLKKKKKLRKKEDKVIHLPLNTQQKSQPAPGIGNLKRDPTIRICSLYLCFFVSPLTE